jgi:hypothetical protein
MALFLDGRFLVQLPLASLGERSQVAAIFRSMSRSCGERARRASVRHSSTWLRYSETFSCRPLQISKVAAASTIPVTSAVAQANIRKSFRILVIAAPCVYGTLP